MPKALITTVPFADKNRQPLDLLEQAGIDYVINPLGRRLKECELAEMVAGFDVLIAGTEPITEKVMVNADRLKLISRVGIGLDSVDLLAARRRGIQVSYTPDAPAEAVAELTIGLMLTLLRSIHSANTAIHQGEWHRFLGRRIPEITIGIIGAGRIGGGVITRLSAFGITHLLVHDAKGQSIIDSIKNASGVAIELVSTDAIFRRADLISVHVPLTAETKNLICKEQLLQMKPDALLINAARGGIINEHDLAEVLNSGHLGGVAIDVFENEPYFGPLAKIDKCLLTAHMGSMSIDCRVRMEAEATEEAVRFLSGQTLRRLVPPEEYQLRELEEV